ncbi:glycogen/starch/alpha-glucan phosphorylase [Granulosicoccus antarcticus]|uniref:Alpha-1,4 glucan phosphorylase n=1 Tax=Granulosicoccus antarcticus IMCC3135 TaxID=1192854 RepID=A0A2Z2NZH1_9GAMM|nr:glycogen/starch/alpha-glucan phosphorylase [Granulosicoccus antarcticus]ASJ72534.1 Maltodextrin phosphorylase [Granulosicoccus antarcticus IMCC3135]
MTSNTASKPTDALEARDLISAGNTWEDRLLSLQSDTQSLRDSVIRHLSQTLGRDVGNTSAQYLYKAVALSVRDRLMQRWLATRQTVEVDAPRQTCYLSMEYLMGRALRNAVHNLSLGEELGAALEELGLTLEKIEQLETDAGLGNGGLGRLAACFLDSCASLGLPVTGYGLRYRYGMFRQSIHEGHQIEHPDNWLNEGHIWELERPELSCSVRFGGRVELLTQEDGSVIHRWVDTDDVRAVPFDVPVPGYANGVVNTLRLWSSTATHEFNLSEFNAGGYTEAVSAKNSAENISMVLYPNDSSENGKALRLRQQYFLVSASLQDALRIWLLKNDGFTGFADAYCFQLNDTHPSLAVAELMRLLVDEHELSWDDAWSITTRVMAYTNHTLLPEALECWSLALIGGLLPRPTEIIQEINRRFLRELEEAMPAQLQQHAEMSIISFDEHPVVRMAHLAIVGSFSINGVAALHSRLLQEGLFKNFNTLWPERFNNKTNGVTQRRWLAYCNPLLSNLLDKVLGEQWVSQLEQLEQLAPMAESDTFQSHWNTIRRQNKQALAQLVAERSGVIVSPDMLFDVQVKRMHEYKRQLLCVLHAVHVYLDLLDGREHPPRFVLIAGKAAPGYYMAKSIIKLINNVAEVINNDERVEGKLKLVFLPDYNVSAMEVICPAADLSEQVSTAGKEASGTGNMKFMMNGAVTIGTLDGANVEIREAVGEANFFLFGLTVDQVDECRGNYSPADIIAGDERLSRLFAAFDDGMFDEGEPGLIRNVIDAARSAHDSWLTVADLPAYLDAQMQVEAVWENSAEWTRMSILNTAHSSRFSTDRTMRDYNRDIWRLQPMTLPE